LARDRVTAEYSSETIYKKNIVLYEKTITHHTVHEDDVFRALVFPPSGCGAAHQYSIRQDALQPRSRGTPPIRQRIVWHNASKNGSAGHTGGNVFG
jgi:hypothetical protein